MWKQYDVIIVGGGYNGLCCVVYLVRVGCKVLVLEWCYVFGGVVVSEEIYLGFIYLVCFYVVSFLCFYII